MVVGNGLVASAFNSCFKDDPNIVVFAAGVSNSRETSSREFLRERRMMIQTQHRGMLILYFSTCSVYDPTLSDTPYVMHKREMEALVRSSKDYAIFRLPQVVGKSANPNTLTNYLYRHIESGQRFRVWLHARRNLIDVSDVAAIVKHLVRTGQGCHRTTNIACPFSVPVAQLVRVFERVLNKKASYDEVESGSAYPIDATIAAAVAHQIGVVFDDSYLENLIGKYYAA